MSATKVLFQTEKNGNTYIISKSSYEVIESSFSVSIYDSDMNRLNCIYYDNDIKAIEGLSNILQEGV